MDKFHDRVKGLISRSGEISITESKAFSTTVFPIIVSCIASNLDSASAIRLNKREQKLELAR